MEAVSLIGASLAGSRLREARLRYGHFSGSTIAGADLTLCDERQLLFPLDDDYFSRLVASV